MDNKKKVEDREELVPGTILEIRDNITSTWIVGILLNVYDCEIHNGIIINVLRPDGSTVDIDCCNADVYTAPEFNIEHFCRTMQRYLYELKEKERLLQRGIELCKSRTLNKQQETEKLKVYTKATCEYDPPITLYVDPVNWPIPYCNSEELIGYIKDNVNSTPPQVMLACWERGGQGPIMWYGCSLRKVNNEFWADASMSPNVNYIKYHQSTMENVSRFASQIESNPNKLRVISLVKKESSSDQDIVTVNVDDNLWFNMGWHPSRSIGKYDPMFLAGTRLLKRGDEPDCWVFIANKQGVFKFVIIPMTKALPYSVIEEACARVYCKPTDLISDSDLLYVDSVIGRWSNDLAERFYALHGRPVTFKNRLFDPIRITPVKMPVPQ